MVQIIGILIAYFILKTFGVWWLIAFCAVGAVIYWIDEKIQERRDSNRSQRL